MPDTNPTSPATPAPTTRTEEEEAARKLLLPALDPIIKGARRKYPDGTAERRAYGIGARLSSASTKALYAAAVYASGRLAPGAGDTPAKDKLKGVLPAEITAIGQLAEAYKNAGWAQTDAQKTAAELLAILRVEIETVLNPLRRDCQGAADQADTYRGPSTLPNAKPSASNPTAPSTSNYFGAGEAVDSGREARASLAIAVSSNKVSVGLATPSPVSTKTKV